MKPVYVVRTHESQWDNYVIVARFYSLYDAMVYIRINFECGACDRYSISEEEEN